MNLGMWKLIVTLQINCKVHFQTKSEWVTIKISSGKLCIATLSVQSENCI